MPSHEPDTATAPGQRATRGHRAPKRRRWRWRVGRRAAWVSLGVVLALLAGAITTAVLAMGSLPGQSLYGLKLDLQRASLDLTRGESAHGQRLLGQASDRLVEVDRLLAEPASPTRTRLVEATYQRAQAELLDAISELEGTYRARRDGIGLRSMDEALPTVAVRLAAITGGLDPAQAAQARSLREQVLTLRERVRTILTTCGLPCDTVTPSPTPSPYPTIGVPTLPGS